jgi:hypothetical protein
MKSLFGILVLLIGTFSGVSNANAANLTVSLEVWNDLSAVQFEEGETISPMVQIQKELLRNCKTELDYRVGSSIRAVNQSRATVGIGKITSVKIGKVYKANQPLYGTEEQVNGDAPPSLNPTYISPCIFSGAVRNLRTASFYTFFIGDGQTEEYDSLSLSKNGWKLNLVLENIVCGNFQNLKIPRGCED